MAIPIIDLFAGPGGLGEGFTSLVDKAGNRIFKIALSIEKDPFAHQTLTLRSFLRQFPHKQLPKEYYTFLRSKERDLKKLYDAYPEQAKKAHEEAWLFELGNEETQHIVDERIKASLRKEKRFVLIGGPPCQAYSLVGRSRRQETVSLNKNDPRVYLYREYYRILAVHNPEVFILENVKGLLSSKVENQSVFSELLNDLSNPVASYYKLLGDSSLKLKCPGYDIYSIVKKPRQDLYGNSYEPSDYVVHSEDYGIPQTRHRVILLGVRKGHKKTPDILTKQESRVAVDAVIKDLPPLRSGLSKTEDTKSSWKKVLQDILSSSIKKEIESSVWKQMEKVAMKLRIPQNDRGSEFIEAKTEATYNKDWYADPKLAGVINHETRSHIPEDLYRYLYLACFAQVHSRSPKLSELPKSLLPKHENISDFRKFDDRFRVQVAEYPSKTITSHISKDGHYYIHPDAKQCRSLTVREAARIQTFPDNYFFMGPRTEQYHQVGNAVPPLLAKQIAMIAGKLF